MCALSSDIRNWLEGDMKIGPLTNPDASGASALNPLKTL